LPPSPALLGIIAASAEPSSEVAPPAFFMEPEPAAAAATGLGGGFASGSSGGGHELDGVLGRSASGKVVLGIRLEDDQSYRRMFLFFVSYFHKYLTHKLSIQMDAHQVPMRMRTRVENGYGYATSNSVSTTSTSHPTSIMTTQTHVQLSPHAQPLAPSSTQSYYMLRPSYCQQRECPL